MKKIIYDLGASTGDNIPYYLLKSDLVVAIEANENSCNIIKKKFSSQINEGRLIVENCIVSDSSEEKDIFYIHKNNHLLGQFPKPSLDMINNFKIISLIKKDIVELINTYGKAFYIKIDLEKFDNVILKRILDQKQIPNYISAETTNNHVINIFTENEFYKSFKIVEGDTIGFLYKDFKFNVNNEKVKYSFPHNSAGPFGNDIFGEWMNKKNFIEFMKIKKTGWTDIHASLIDEAEDIESVKPYLDHDQKLKKKAKLIKRILRFKSKFSFF